MSLLPQSAHSLPTHTHITHTDVEHGQYFGTLGVLQVQSSVVYLFCMQYYSNFRIRQLNVEIDMKCTLRFSLSFWPHLICACCCWFHFEVRHEYHIMWSTSGCAPPSPSLPPFNRQNIIKMSIEHHQWYFRYTGSKSNVWKYHNLQDVGCRLCIECSEGLCAVVHTYYTSKSTKIQYVGPPSTTITHAIAGAPPIRILFLFNAKKKCETQMYATHRRHTERSASAFRIKAILL